MENPKSHMDTQRPQITKAALGAMAEVPQISDLKLHYRVTVTTEAPASSWHQNRHIEEQKRENAKPHSCCQVIFDKEVKHKLWRKDGFIKVWENWISTWERMKLDPYFSPCTKTNSD